MAYLVESCLGDESIRLRITDKLLTNTYRYTSTLLLPIDRFMWLSSEMSKLFASFAKLEDIVDESSLSMKESRETAMAKKVYKAS